MNKKNKKVIAVTLAVSIVTSCFSPILVSFAKGDMGDIDIPFFGSKEQAPQNVGAIHDLKDENAADKKEVIKARGDGQGEVIYKGTKKSTSNDGKNHDLYNLNQEDLEGLMKQGHKIEDIFKADEIGNEILEDPKKLLERKKREGKELDVIKEEVKAERKNNFFEKLKKKYPNEYNQLKNDGTNEDDAYAILAFYNSNEVNSISNLAKEYKKDGQEAFRRNLKAKKKKVSEDRLEKHGLTEKDAEGLSDDIIDQIERIAKTNNKSIKELVAEYKTAKESYKGGK